jgi:hypothetical protein
MSGDPADCSDVLDWACGPVLKCPVFLPVFVGFGVFSDIATRLFTG